MATGPKRAPGDALLRFHVSSKLEVSACRRALPCDCDALLGTYTTLETAALKAGQPPVTITYAKGREPKMAPRGKGRPPALSPEQIAFLPRLVERGLTQKEIAQQLGVAQPTVNRYLKQHSEALASEASQVVA